MNFQRTTINAVCILKINKIPSSIKNLISITTVNEGSHTRLIQYTINSPTKISILQKSKKKIRYVWLGTYLYKNITFARSLWKIPENCDSNKKSIINKPIGLSFIKNKIDIHKYIYELYYCHCNKFEEELESKKPLWGRKYIIYKLNKQNVIIQEFFSTKLNF